MYIHEAHADDIWPLGYGVRNHRNIEERWAACDAFLERYAVLRHAVDDVVVDSMADEFLHRNGAWPERYFFVNAQGKTLWASQLTTEDSQASLVDARKFAVASGWLQGTTL